MAAAVPALPAARSTRPRRRVLRAAVVTIVVWGLWAGALAVFDIAPYHVPQPGTALQALIEGRAFVLTSLRVTLLATVAGLAVSAAVATTLAALFVASPTTERALLPLAVTVRSIPIVAMAPLLTIVAGRGFRTSLFCVTVVTFFPILVNAAQGFRSIPPPVRELFAVNGASRWQLFRHARLPASVPYVFTGLRVAASVGVLGAMTAEWLTGTAGLGFLLVRAAGRRELGLLWAGVIVATGTAVALFALTSAVERRFTRRYAPGQVEG